MSIYKPQVKRFCKEFENIENYQEAINSPEKYDCHHRLEETGLSKKDLIDMNMYYNRPANELIFLTHKTHISLHKKGNKNCLGKAHSIETKKKMSDAQKGDKNYRYKFICPIKLAYMYNRQNMTINEIAKELNVSRFLIWKRLQELKK